jgi:hypothetical protein
MNNYLLTNKLISSINSNCTQNNQTTNVISFSICNSHEPCENTSRLLHEENKECKDRQANRNKNSTENEFRQNSAFEDCTKADSPAMDKTFEDKPSYKCIRFNVLNEVGIYGPQKNLANENNIIDKKRRKGSKGHQEKTCGETSKLILIFRSRFLCEGRKAS